MKLPEITSQHREAIGQSFEKLSLCKACLHDVILSTVLLEKAEWICLLNALTPEETLDLSDKEQMRFHTLKILLEESPRRLSLSHFAALIAIGPWTSHKSDLARILIKLNEVSSKLEETPHKLNAIELEKICFFSDSICQQLEQSMKSQQIETKTTLAIDYHGTGS